MRISHASQRTAAHETRSAAGNAKRDAGCFRTTHWSVVLQAGSGSAPEAGVALEQFCCQYWRPIYFYVRRRGYNADDARDLTQGFFARLLERGGIRMAEQGRGRFRTFLLAALDNFLANEWDRSNRLKRGGGQRVVSLDETAEADASYRLLDAGAATPDQIYDRRWAQTILETVLRRLREEFDHRGGGGRFEILKSFLFSHRGELSYADEAARLGLSDAAMKSAIYRLRQRYGELFAEEIAATVAAPDEVDDEIRYLLATLEGG